MIIRDARLEDNTSIAAIHLSSRMNYKFPDLTHPLFVVRKVAEKDGEVQAACFLRISAETYLFLKPELNPRVKLSTMLALQPEVLSAAWSLGIDDVEARIPEDVEIRFSKRLHQLGWSRNRGWSAWSHETSIM